MSEVGIVVIGRNEGQRLRKCLESLAGWEARTVYVDSGSTDGSVEYARSRGVEAVELDAGRPFSAARARNEGLARLGELCPAMRYVQFVDGDCEIAAGWLERAAAELENRPELAAVCGRLREREPEASIYNRLCDMEWHAPVGEVKACGGVAMYRAAALQEAGGFNPAVIAGEEPELCLRLRGKGWKIVRLEHDMALHDAAMLRFGQWWRRSVRGGHAYAEGAAMHGRGTERYNVKSVMSALLWGFVMPALACVSVAMSVYSLRSLLLGGVVLLLTTILVIKVSRYRMRLGDDWSRALLYASFLLPAKVAQCIGIARYVQSRLRGRRSSLIEHKARETSTELQQSVDGAK